jgi:hypothetical protein
MNKITLNLTILLAVAISVSSCGTKRAKELATIPEVDHTDTIKKDYLVTDASHTTRPIWAVDAQLWAEENERNTEEFRYFSYETDPKTNREMSCELAKSTARSDIAAEITSFIQYNLSSSKEGDASIDLNNPKARKLSQYMETTLAQKVQALITGAAVLKLYWEKRNYKKELGANDDFMGFTCSALLRMEKNRTQKRDRKS